jgi:hypothetical protein
MADLSRKTASIYINHQSATEALESLQAKANKLADSIKKGEAAGKNMVKEINKLNQVKNDIAGVQKQIDSGLRPSFNQLSATVSRLRNELKRMSEDAPGYAAKFKAFNAASTELQRMQSTLSGINKEGGILKGLFAQAIPLIGIAAVTGFLKGAVDEALAAERATSRLNNTLSNLGRTDAFDRLINKAEEMADTFTFIDNDDVIGVFEQLITYGKLTETQIKQLTPVIIDFAAKSRISLAESASVIIKALEGNGKALKEYGINIKDAGTEAERLNVIMTTLKDKVDGAAAAFANTSEGSIASATQQFANLKEEIGTQLLPVLNQLLTFFKNAIYYAGILGKAMKATFGEVGRVVTPGNAVKLDAQDNDNNRNRQGIVNLQLSELKRRNVSLDQVKAGLEKENQKVTELKQKYNDLIKNASFFSFSKDQLFQQLKSVKQEIFTRETQIDAASLFIDELTNRTLGIAPPAANEKKDASAKSKEAVKKVVKQVNELKEQFYKAVKLAIEEEDDPAPRIFVNAAQAGFAAATKKRLEQLAAQLQLATGKERLKIKLEQLDTERVIELNNTEITEVQKAAIQKKFRDAAQEETLDYYLKIAQTVIDFAQKGQELLNAIAAGKNNKDDARIEKLTAAYDAEGKANANLLNRKIIDQETYDRKQKQLEDKKEKELSVIKRRQFERNKNAELVQAGISAAQSVLSTIKQFGPPLPPNILGILAMGLTVATNIANINAIRSKQPTFARGGVFDGPSHAEGGMPVYSRGRKVAELEGGEPILSRNTYKNNRPIIDALLHSSMYRNGATIGGMVLQPHSMLNYPAVNRSFTVQRKYERGGVFNADGAIGGDALGSILQQLALQLQTPIRAYLPYSDINAAQEIDNKIKTETTFKRG